MNPVDTYFQNFPDEVKDRMSSIRTIILQNVPDVTESISYAMPAYKLNGKPLVYFAGYKGHIGFYATPEGHKEFEKDLGKFKQGKGSVQFPLNQDLPIDLIKKIVLFKKALIENKK